MNIKGKERPFKFCLNSLIEFADGKPLEEILNNWDKIDLLGYLRLTYCCFKYGAKSEGQEIDFTQENVNDWIWEDMSKLDEIKEEIFKSMPSKNPKAPQKGGKQPGTK